MKDRRCCAVRQVAQHTVVQDVVDFQTHVCDGAVVGEGRLLPTAVRLLHFCNHLRGGEAADVHHMAVLQDIVMQRRLWSQTREEGAKVSGEKRRHGINNEKAKRKSLLFAFSLRRASGQAVVASVVMIVTRLGSGASMGISW